MMSIPKDMLNLLKTAKASASEITAALKELGKGSMLEGFKTTYTHAYTEGKKSGGVAGTLIGLSIGISGTLCTIYAINKHKQQTKDGKMIYDTFSKELSSSPESAIEASSINVQSPTDDTDSTVSNE